MTWPISYLLMNYLFGIHCWKFPQVRQSEANNFGRQQGTSCWFWCLWFEIQAMMTYKFFDWVSNTVDIHEFVFQRNSYDTLWHQNTTWTNMNLLIVHLTLCSMFQWSYLFVIYKLFVYFSGNPWLNQQWQVCASSSLPHWLLHAGRVTWR